MVTDLGSPITQAGFGALVGISQQAVSDLVWRGILTDAAPAAEWLLHYCEHLRGIAAGRGGEGSLELTAERARLARAQAEKVEMQNAVTRGELAPTILLEQVLARAGSKAGRILESIPGTLRRRRPDLSGDDVAAIAAVVAKARNLAASIRLADLQSDEDAEDAVDLDADEAST